MGSGRPQAGAGEALASSKRAHTGSVHHLRVPACPRTTPPALTLCLVCCELHIGKLQRTSEPLPKEDQGTETEQRNSSSKVTQERQSPSPQEGHIPASHLSHNREGPKLIGGPPPPPTAPSRPPAPTSAPTGPPTSCHCLGLNPSSAPAAWRARPGLGAAGPQGCPLMPSRVGGQDSGKVGLRPLAHTAWACLSASCPLQKPGELIKNGWARREGSKLPTTQPQRCRPALSCRALPPGLLCCAAADVATSPEGSGYCNQCHWLHLPFQCPCWGLR